MRPPQPEELKHGASPATSTSVHRYYEHAVNVLRGFPHGHDARSAVVRESICSLASGSDVADLGQLSSIISSNRPGSPWKAGPPPITLCQSSEERKYIEYLLFGE